MTLVIQQAAKVKQYARVCLWGTPKAGKTHTALTLATAFAGEGGKIGVISSEYGSSKLLAHKFPHDIVDLAAPDEFGNPVKNAFSPQRYEEALQLFLKAGYKAIVIDSLSHSWNGEGGILGAVDKSKNSFSDGWKDNTPIYDHLVNAVLGAKCHIIVTLRAKEAYVMEEYTKRDGSKGTTPKNVGQAPVMRKGFGFEMQLTIRMDSMNAHIEASGVEDHIHKGEEIEKPGPELAYRLLDALDGVEVPEQPEETIAMNRLLGEFQSLYPTHCSKTPQWRSEVLKKVLEVEVVPTSYTADEVARMSLYIASKKHERATKAANGTAA